MKTITRNLLQPLLATALQDPPQQPPEAAARPASIAASFPKFLEKRIPFTSGLSAAVF